MSSQNITDDPRTWPHSVENGGKARDLPDGGKEFWTPDGTRTFTRRDGETWKQILPTGQTIELLPDGGQTQTEPDGTKITKQRNGTVGLVQRCLHEGRVLTSKEQTVQEKGAIKITQMPIGIVRTDSNFLCEPEADEISITRK